MFKNACFSCKVYQDLSGVLHSRALQYDRKSNNSEYNQLPTAAKRKAPNICQALVDSSELRNLKLIQTASEVPHRHFQLLVKIQ